MATPNYPLKFNPIYKTCLWGGDWHYRYLGALVPPEAKIGESWEISDRPGENSVVCNGALAGRTLRSLIEEFPHTLLGPGGKARQRFPLLIKFLGSAAKLSLQVHPDDAYAARHHRGELGKSEMFLILEHWDKAELKIGFKQYQTIASVRAALAEERFEQLVNAIPVSQGDVFFLPAGRVHGIGAGMLLVEVEENSDITYRVYDYARQDEQGHPRALHVEQALEVIDLSDTSTGRLEARGRYDQGNTIRELVDDVHFTSELITYIARTPGKQHAGFLVAIVTRGEGDLEYASGAEALKRGTVLLLPAGFADWLVAPASSGLEILWTWVGA